MSNYQTKSDRTNKWRMDCTSEEVKKSKRRIELMKERKTGIMEKRKGKRRGDLKTVEVSDVLQNTRQKSLMLT